MDEFKRELKNWNLRHWEKRRMHGKFISEIHTNNKQTNKKNAWEWLRKLDLKEETETLTCAAQDHLKYNINKTRMPGERRDSVGHIICKSKKLAQKCKRWHSNIAQNVH